MADTDKLVKVGQLDAVADAVIEVVSDTNGRLDQQDDDVDLIFNRVNTSSDYVQGARYSDSNIMNVSVISTRCTSKNVWHFNVI